jgi:hypothetical protein
VKGDVVFARISHDGGFEFCKIHGTICTWSLLLKSNSLSGSSAGLCYSEICSVKLELMVCPFLRDASRYCLVG